MKTIVIDVHDLLSPLSARGVEKQLAKLPGIKQVDVNSVSRSARVVYDETVTGLDAIKAKVRECGHHCCGELMPKHLCKQDPAPADAQAMADTTRAVPVSATPPAQHRQHTGHVEQAQPAQAAEHGGIRIGSGGLC